MPTDQSTIQDTQDPTGTEVSSSVGRCQPDILNSWKLQKRHTDASGEKFDEGDRGSKESEGATSKNPTKVRPNSCAEDQMR